MTKKIFITLVSILLFSTQLSFASAKYPDFCPIFTRTFGRGDSGVDIKKFQIILGQEGYGYLSGTGYFGPATEKSVKLLQKKLGFQPTGGVGLKTLNKLKSLWCSNGNNKEVMEIRDVGYNVVSLKVKTCTPGEFTVEWGHDSSQSKINIDTCNSQTIPDREIAHGFPHAGGTFLIILRDPNGKVIANQTLTLLENWPAELKQPDLGPDYKYSKSGSKTWTLQESGMLGEFTNGSEVTGSIVKEIAINYNRNDGGKFTVSTVFKNNSNRQTQVNTCYEQVYLSLARKYYYYSYTTGYFYDQRPTHTCVNDSLFKKLNPGESVSVLGKFVLSIKMLSTAYNWGIEQVEVGESNYDKIIFPTEASKVVR